MTTHDSGRFALAFGTLGIVFGDIGTSPIYAFRESFEVSEIEVTRAPHTALLRWFSGRS